MCYNVASDGETASLVLFLGRYCRDSGVPVIYLTMLFTSQAGAPPIQPLLKTAVESIASIQ